ncbi:hypothetical protein E2C01_006446 [Portunus trituberculatus]|uniref:Uncharacterized protein n=1 Tax=Portunus trituberculatus TaxID=210409 RepID=A0A5B7CXW8_PORTR|nr:hypothetical protein [Portunus trituberculatus]
MQEDIFHLHYLLTAIMDAATVFTGNHLHLQGSGTSPCCTSSPPTTFTSTDDVVDSDAERRVCSIRCAARAGRHTSIFDKAIRKISSNTNVFSQ